MANNGLFLKISQRLLFECMILLRKELIFYTTWETKHKRMGVTGPGGPKLGIMGFKDGTYNKYIENCYHSNKFIDNSLDTVKQSFMLDHCILHGNKQ